MSNRMGMEHLLKVVKVYGMRANDVAGIVWEIVAAVIHDSLECPDRAKDCRLSIIKASY